MNYHYSNHQNSPTEIEGEKCLEKNSTLMKLHGTGETAELLTRGPDISSQCTLRADYCL